MQVRNYQLKKELGRGTFGVTYLGYDNLRYDKVRGRELKSQYYSEI